MSPTLPERKHPAHLPNFERRNEPVIVFLTVCTHERRPVLASAAVVALLTEAWNLARQWRVGRFLVMPDHVHLFCSPTSREAEGVRDWAAYWKGLASRGLGGHGPLAHHAQGGRGVSRVASSREGAVPPAPGCLGCADGVAAVPPFRMPGEGAASPAPGRLGCADGVAAVPPIWQRDGWDTQLRSADHYHEKWGYVRMNPVRKGLVGSPDEWPFHGELNVLWW